MALIERTNNPLNIRYNQDNDWLGQVGQDSGFASFSDRSYGYRAADRVLENYGKGGVNTLRGAISRFAPPTENDTDNYVTFVSGRLGLDPDAEIDLSDPRTRANMLSAMAKMETGTDITPDELSAALSSLGEKRFASTPSVDQQPDGTIDMTAAQQAADRATVARRVTQGGAPDRSNNIQLASADRDRGTDILSAINMFDTAKSGKYAGMLNTMPAPGENQYRGMLDTVEPTERFVSDPGTLSNAFGRGVSAGVSALESDFNYFGALFNTLTGDEDGVATRIDRARQAEANSANIMEGMQTFEQFLDEPTVYGFLQQAFSAAGQVTPMAATAIGTSLTGAVIGTAGKLGANAAARGVTKKLMNDVLKKVQAEGVDALTPDEQDVLKASYQALQKQYAGQSLTSGLGTTAKRGALAGAYAQEFPMMSGGSFAEFDEAGVELTPERAFQSLLIGAPLAAVGVGGEAFIVNSFRKLALSKASKSSDSVLRQYAQDLGGSFLKSGATEAATEVVQEGGLIAQRMAVDEDYTAEEAQLRLAQSAFAGFFGGAGLGAAGGSVAGIFKAANTMIRDKAEARISAAVDSERTGLSDDLGSPTQESTADLSAQLDAAFDDNSSKAGVWLPNQRLPQVQEDNTVVEVSSNGRVVYAAHVPGKGTIVSPSQKVTEAVVEANASDATLASVLGYSGTKPEDADRVVRVRDVNGNVISEEATNADGEVAATAAANAIATEGATVETVSVEQALTDRKTRFDEEQTREMRFNEEDPNFTEEDAARQAGMRIMDEDSAGMPVEEQAVRDDGEPAVYKVGDPTKRNPDFEDRWQTLLDLLPVERHDEFNRLKVAFSDSALSFMISRLQDDPEYSYFATVQLVDEQPTLSFGRIQTGLGIESGGAKDAVEFVLRASRKLGRKTKETAVIRIRKPDGKVISTTLGILIGAGKRLNVRSKEALLGEGLTEAQQAKQGLLRISKELNLRGYVLEDASGKPLTLTAADLTVTGESNSARARRAAGVDNLSPQYKGYTYRDIINAPDPRPAPKPGEVNQEVKARKAGEKAVQRFDRQRERRRSELVDDGRTEEQIDNILAEEFSEERRQEVGRQAERDRAIAGPDKVQTSSDPVAPIRTTNPLTGATQIEVNYPGLPQQPEGIIDPLGRAAADAEARGVFRGEAADIEQQRRIGARAGRQPMTKVGGPQRPGEPMVDTRQQRTRDGRMAAPTYAELPTVEGVGDEAVVITRPERVVPDISQPNIFSRILLEDMPTSQPSVASIPQKNRAGRRAEQAQMRREADNNKGANSVIINDGLPPITSRLLGAAMKLFSFTKTVHIISLSDLKKNPAKYTEGRYAKISGWLEATINRMDNNPVQGRYLPTTDAHVIVINDLDADGGKVSDAVLGTVLAHEIGHIVFQEEQENLVSSEKNAGRRRMLWEAFKKHVEGMDTIPDQYDMTKEGFEEWYADQVAAYVYNQAKSAETGAQSYFKSIAKKLRDFFTEVNRLLGGRIMQNEVFREYMDGVVEANRNNRKTVLSDSGGRVLGMVEKLGIREMIQEVQAQDWFNRVSRNYEALAARILRSPTYKWLNKWLGTTDGYLRELGPAGVRIAQFFYNKSQSLEKTGFHQAKNIMFNRFSRRLGQIFGLDVTDSEKSWADPEIESALLLAEDETVTNDDLRNMANDPNNENAQAAAKALEVRDLFSEIFDKYIINPDTGRPWFNIRKRENYSPRMLDFVQVEQNPDAFIELLRSYDFSETEIAAVMDSLNVSEYGANVSTESTVEESELPTFVIETIERLREEGTPEAEIRQIVESYVLTQNLRAQVRARQLRLINELFSKLDPETVSRKARLSPGMDPAAVRALARIPTKVLREKGFLVPPGLSMIQYFHQVARKVEFERRGGFRALDDLISQLPEEERGFVEEIIEGNLGKRGAGMSSKWRTFNSIAAVHTVMTTLLFTVFASLTDLAGIATRMKEVGDIQTFFKEALHAGRESYQKDGMFDRAFDWAGFETDRQRIDFAADVGVVSMEALDNMFISVGELDFADSWARKSMNTFFEWTGLQWYTRATRILATKMGEKFIIRSATDPNFGPRQERYLAELGLTREQVLENYNEETGTLNINGANADIIRMAIARFAEESIIRPNPSERPSWANNPYFTIVWQLKSYFYAYGKTVIGGIGREIKNRYREDGDFSGGAQTLLLAAGFMIPLTMLGLESREYTKWMIQYLLPGVDASAYTFRSDHMDGGEYLWEIFNRSGVLGPLSIGVTTVESLQWEGPLGPLIANIPFVDAFDDTFVDGDWNRPIPVLNNIQ